MNGRMKGDLQERTKDFALKAIRLYSELPRAREAQVIGDQLLRSGTSVGAHIREAQRAKSKPDFISKIEGGMQELEETIYLAGAAGWSETRNVTAIGTTKKRGRRVNGDLGNNRAQNQTWSSEREKDLKSETGKMK